MEMSSQELRKILIDRIRAHNHNRLMDRLEEEEVVRPVYVSKYDQLKPGAKYHHRDWPVNVTAYPKSYFHSTEVDPSYVTLDVRSLTVPDRLRVEMPIRQEPPERVIKVCPACHKSFSVMDYENVPGHLLYRKTGEGTATVLFESAIDNLLGFMERNGYSGEEAIRIIMDMPEPDSNFWACCPYTYFPHE